MNERRFHHRALHVFTLSAIALSARIYAAVGGQPMFFSIRQAEALDLFAFVFVLSALVPAAILLVEWLAARAAARLFRAGDAAGDLVHAAAVFLLLSAAAMPIVKSVAALPGLLAMGIGFALGGAATAAYWRLAAARAVVSILSPIALLSPGWFLFLSPASRFLVRWSPPRALAVRVGNPAPAVMVIFDEFSGISLMDRDRRIDRERFPNLAALADDGVWFRNATTVSGETESAIPAVLTGNRPAPGATEPCAAEYPYSLFTLLGKSHRVTAVEPLTSLCPDDLCGRPATQMPWLRRVRSYLIDAAVLEWAILLPAEGPLAGPHVAGRWGCFLDQDNDAAWGDPMVRRREAFDAFLAKIRPEKQPTLYFAHAVLPHKPWIYLPSGKEYLPMPLPRQLDRNAWVADGAIGWLRATECWTTDPWAVAQARRRYLLQIAMVDRLVGRLVQRLKQTGLYDRSLIVVTADHGVCFLAGQSLRKVGKATCPEIMPVPLLMKLPAGPRGVVSDRNVESIDILPTMAQVLQVALPWKAEGVSALDPSLPERPRKEIIVTGGAQPPLHWEAAFPEKYAALQRTLAEMGGGDRGNFAPISPHDELLGRPLSACRVAAAPAGRVELTGAEGLDRLDLSAPRLPCHLGGRLLGLSTPRRPVYVAVAVNGAVRAVTRTFSIAGLEDFFTVMLPEDALRRGRNDVRFFVVSGRGDATIFSPLASAPAQGRDAAP